VVSGSGSDINRPRQGGSQSEGRAPKNAREQGLLKLLLLVYRAFWLPPASAVRRPYSARSFATSDALSEAIGSHSEVLKRGGVSKVGDRRDSCC
jgi:hypothetical protein